MKAKDFVEKEVNYKVKCIKDVEFDTTKNTIYDCSWELYDPDTKELLLIQIIDDAGDEHAVSPDFFERVA